MTILDSSLTARAAGLYGRWEQRWEYPRLLAVLFVLAFASSVSAVVSGGLGQGGAWKGTSLFGVGAESFGTFSSADENWEQVKVCGRIHQIVETACGLKQYDHDAEGIRQCIGHELKYTMWSAYNCG